MEQIYYPLYDKYFTEAELKDLIAFYKSPTGRKLLHATPQLTQAAMLKSNELLMPKIMVLLNELREEEKKGSKQ